MADRLLPDKMQGDDGEPEDRMTVSLLSGPEPEIRGAPDENGERNHLQEWLSSILDRGIEPSEIAILGRTNAAHKHCTTNVLKDLALQSCNLTESEPSHHQISVGTLHGSKGLEFRAVAIVGCANGIMPLGNMPEGSEIAIEDTTERERQLLYVGLTRARESLLVTYSGQPSIFLKELTRNSSPSGK